MSKAVVLKGDFVRKEAVASEAITPGHLIEFGGSNDVQKQSSAAEADAAKTWALENDLVGDDLDDDYASGDTVQYAVFDPGSELQALLAHGENVSEGDALEADGNGALQAHSSGRVLAFAREDLNNTSGSESRIDVEVA